MRRPQPVPALSACAFVLVAAWSLAMGSGCGDKVVYIPPENVEVSTGSGFDGLPAGFSDAGPTDAGAADGGSKGDGASSDTGPTGQPGDTTTRVLTFAQQVGDNDIPCVGTDHCAIQLSYQGSRGLEVQYEVNGSGAGNQLVHFEITDDPAVIGHLSAFSAYTDSSGIATVEVDSPSGLVGEFTVHVWVEGANELFFDVTVTPKGQVPLTVLETYNGLRQWDTWQVKLYRQNGEPDDLLCTDLEALFFETADWLSPHTNEGLSVKKLEFPGLEEDTQQHYTILAYAEDPAGDSVIVWGCDDTSGVVKWGSGTTVSIELMDRPPLYAGTYEVHSFFDLVSALPSPIDDYVNVVLDVLKNPVAGLMELMCLIADSALEDICDFVFQDPANPDIDELTATGEIISNIVNLVIASFANGTVAGDILTGGKDVAEVLTGFEVEGTITLATEPDLEGNWYPGEATESWDSAIIKWSLGANCDPWTDENCGKKKFSFAAIQGEAPISGDFSAHVENMWMFSIAMHPLDVKYGVLLNFIIENVLLPLVAGDGTNGAPLVNSYELFLMSLVGGQECLLPGFGMTCCEAFTDDVVGSGAGIAESLVNGACDALVTLGAGFFEQQIAGIDGDSAGYFNIGTLGQCQFYDIDYDMVVDGFGTKTAPCAWDVEVTLFGATTTIDGEFYAERDN